MKPLASINKRAQHSIAFVVLLVIIASSATGAVASGNRNRIAQVGVAQGNACTVGASGATYTKIQDAVNDTSCATINVADMGVVCGSILLILDMIRPKRQAANVP